jgi:hypothetical protein
MGTQTRDLPVCPIVPQPTTNAVHCVLTQCNASRTNWLRSAGTGSNETAQACGSLDVPYHKARVLAERPVTASYTLQ